MAQKYNHVSLEKKWQDAWAKEKVYATTETSDKPKAYVLDMFPYPSGAGLHVGHPKGYIATDVYSRFKRMNGFNILHPMGWDAFGLPAEEYAIKNKIHPRIAVEKNIKRYKEQLEILGFNYDWDREINTTDPAYYKWTQWIFLQMFKDGLAYESHEPINWCSSCKTGLANEDLEGGKCERCGSPVEKRPIRQWVLRITDYAEDLLHDLKDLAWPESIKESQKNWIGKSEGAEFEFSLLDVPGQPDGKHKVKVFTTRPDTLFGVTFVAISAARAKLWLDIGWKASEEVKKFINRTLSEEATRALDAVPPKDGIFTGIYTKNPANGEKIPVWIANYVLSDYGSGVIMAVPAHDERDFEFAKKFNLPIKNVIHPAVVRVSHVRGEREAPFDTTRAINEKLERILKGEEAYVWEGMLRNSGKYDGMDNKKAAEKITESFGGKKTTYKLKDWVFSRQRYWGEPIPLIHCEKCGVVPVLEKDLPVTLPEVKYYEPTGTGESPLAAITDWVNVECPKCGGKGERETNTMPQWAGSCWYYLRYMDPKGDSTLVDSKREKYWAPVDMYVGGTEHATRHLIYARFWHKFLHKIGVVSTKEPFMALRNQGLIMGTDGRKMSKRFGNVINPDDIVKRFGADTMRVYEMFMGPFEASIDWSTDNLVGSRHFVERVWNLQDKVVKEGIITDETLYNRTVKQVSEDIENFRLNTVVSDLMILLNSLEKEKAVPQSVFETFITLLAPLAPHITEELWHNIGNTTSIHQEKWPTYNASKLVSDTMTVAVQVNGKIRAEFQIFQGATEEETRTQALSLESVKKWIGDKEIKKAIYVKGKLISFVV